MDYSPLISVIVPCYNQAEYLPDTLQSVLDQSYTNWECIIVNDGSSDNTEKVATQWVNIDIRFKYLKEENGGVSKARNKGIEVALGEWILPLDGDDIIAKDYLRLAVEVIKDNSNVGIIYCKVNFFSIKEGKWDLPPFDIKKLLIRNQIFNCGFFKKEDWRKAGGYDEKMVYGREDWEFWINLLKTTNKEVIQLDYLGFFYRIKDTSRNVNFMADKKKIYETELRIYEKHKDLYNKHFGSVIEILAENERLIEENKELLQRVNNIESLFIYKAIKKFYNLFRIKKI